MGDFLLTRWIRVADILKTYQADSGSTLMCKRCKSGPDLIHTVWIHVLTSHVAEYRKIQSIGPIDAYRAHLKHNYKTFLVGAHVCPIQHIVKKSVLPVMYQLSWQSHLYPKLDFDGLSYVPMNPYYIYYMFKVLSHHIPTLCPYHMAHIP